MRLGILLFTPIFLLAGVTLHAQEAVNAPNLRPRPIRLPMPS